ncbi:3-oxoacyl-[acyl-carrier protein] reductase [Thermotomaculum hydrothermale]|uniref:3-oxoacyl-[acyl-carrier-protein] reductase n=1 Tax=Thermotomaculum hydrothermale TaxID=981385 RepID=A0A7R6SZ68_9BACT|nr:3-oxoacyl-ACP reductase FabG [Thermotomaculum hydrothermale]BBB33539.1 3-oxoacyl-[acyl-carrier protein] reductase [Thermotomaculum hydrothermale]
MIDLTGKTAIVTGASRGIGKAIAEKLSEAGAKVILIARNEERLKELAAKLGNSPYFTLDITDREKVKEVFKEIQKQYDIDILVNNAGITRDNILMMMKDNEIESVIDTNLKSIFYVTKQVLRKMLKKRSGRIINITSVIGLMGNPGQSNYAASKAGIIGFTKSLAKEIGSRNITVNAIAPGFIETDMTKDLSEETKKAMLETIPLKRTGTPEDIANAVLFLASDLASYITGTVLNVSGGMYM